MSVISLLSDFGSVYPAQMKGVILNIDPTAVLVDIAHDIPPQDIAAGAFALMITIPYFPEGTIHLAVIDPGVGSDRRPVLVESGGHLLVGPDNGLLIPAAYRLSQDIIVRKITNEDLFSTVSFTFHGRDIFAPVAAYLSNGLKPSDIGEEIKDYVKLDFATPQVKDKRVLARVIFIDGFGNLITNISGEHILNFFNYNDKLVVENRIISFVHTYTQVKSGEMLMLIGSHGYLEISINSGNAAAQLGLGIGDPLWLSAHQ